MNSENHQNNFQQSAAFLWCFFFVAVRIFVMTCLYFITGGNEVASDVDYHTMLIQQPLGIIGGTAPPDIASYAPLQSFITWPIYTAYNFVFPAFISIRLLMMTIEFACFVVFMSILKNLRTSSTLSTVLCMSFVLAPHQFLTSVVFVQDEVICSLFLLLCFLLKISNRYLSSLFALAAGVLIGKIFLIVPLFYVTVFGNTKMERWPKHWFLPLLLIAGVYALVVLMVQQNNGNLPLVGFTPSADYSVMYWTLILQTASDISTYKNLSLLLTIATQSVLSLYLIYQCYLKKKHINSTLLISLPLAVFFLTFYQHNSEYSMMIAAVALLSIQRTHSVLVLASIFSFAWVPKFLFGLKNIGLNNATASETRNDLLGGLVEQLGVNLTQLHAASIVIYSVLFLFLVIVLFSQLFQTNESASPRR